VAALFILTVHQAAPVAPLRAERPAHVRIAVLHRRASRHPAAHRQRRRASYRQLADQTTQWTTTTIGTFIGGYSAARFGYSTAFVINSLSFVLSAWCISRIQLPRGAPRRSPAAMTEADVMAPVPRVRRGTAGGTSRRSRLLLAIALLGVGWASGGGAAQILFSLFGEMVFHRGPAGIGVIWAAAGLGLIIGGANRAQAGAALSFTAYKRTIAVCLSGCTAAHTCCFSQSERFQVALVWIALSRAAVAVSS